MSLYTAASIAATDLPRLTVCLVNQSDDGTHSIYSANIYWGDIKENQYARFDVIAEDGSNANWPQFRNDSFHPPTEHRNFSVDNSVSIYPLSFLLVGLSRDAADSFDGRCRSGSGCSIDTEATGVTTLAKGNIVPNPAKALPC
jgi:hypothetical protein